MSVDEVLIEAIREYPFLYDTNDKMYHDNARKDDAWQEISERFCNMSAAMCKKRWSSLRDAFRKNYKLKIASMNSTEKKKKPYRYDEQLSFLIPYLVEREPPSDVPVFIKHNFKEAVSDTSSIDSSIELNTRTSYTGEEVQIAADEKSFDQTLTRHTVKTQEITSAPFTSQKRKHSILELNDLIGYEVVKPIELHSTSGDALTTFFKAMEDTVRGFSPGMVIEAKGKISALVNELELKNWEQQQLVAKSPANS